MMFNLNTKSKPEAIKFAKATVIHAYFEEAIEALFSVHKSFHTEPIGLIITGDPGLGKSRVTEFYRMNAQVDHGDARDHQTVIVVETPSKRTVTNFYRSILESLGESNLDQGPRRSIADMESMILRLLKTLKVELIIFDEAHNLLPRSGEGPTSTIANTIKMLMNKTKIPMVMVGERDTVQLRQNQPAIQSRFAATHTLSSLSFNRDEPHYLGAYLEALQEHIDAEHVSFSNHDMVLRMYLASAGNPREIRNLMINLLDYSDLSSRLTENEFALAFDITGSNPMRLDFNPFRAKMPKVRKKLGLER